MNQPWEDGRQSGEVELEIQRAIDAPDLPEDDAFRQWVAAALGNRREAAALTIRLVDAEEGRELNHAYRQKDYATNVLSFPLTLPEAVEIPYIGDLAICAPVVAREAGEQGKPARAHWAHMTVHGVLHLLGFDHQNSAEAREMEGLERQIMAALGFADPYEEDD